MTSVVVFVNTFYHMKNITTVLSLLGIFFFGFYLFIYLFLIIIIFIVVDFVIH